ncbi:MAG TPA: site-2 protease family protein [Polyangiaceae bacterium]|nr:site-2 protease family protein [Polyangiaceae bacterium]
MSGIAEFLVWYLVFVFSTTCHEAAHAWVARRGGDSTAYALGHVTLDPLPHIRREPFGMVIVPILSFFQLGWIMGWASVPFDPLWGARHPKRWALMSLAGPATNFLLAAMAFAALRGLSSMNVLSLTDAGGVTVGLVQLPPGYALNSPLGALGLGLTALLKMNVILGLYNLLPVPPLDGAAVVEGFAPRGLRSLYDSIRRNPMLQLLMLLGAWYVFPTLLNPVFRVVLRSLYS